MITLLLACAVLATAGVFIGAERSHQRQQRRQAASAAVTALRHSVGGVLAEQAALARVLGTLPTPIGQRWPALARTVMSEPLAESTGYVVAVPGTRRRAFERRTGLDIVALDGHGSFRPAPRSAHYFVLEHLVQRPGLHSRAGADLGLSAVRRALLERTARSGRQLASAPIALLSDRHARGVVVYVAVRGPDGRVRGWVAATYATDRLARTVTRSAPGLTLTIADGRRLLVGTHIPHGSRPALVAVAGRTWRVWAVPPAQGLGPTPWLILGLGLSLVAGVALVLRQAVTRERYASRQVQRHLAAERDRQAELAAERRALADAQSIARVGSWSVDPATGTIEWSDEMYRIFDRTPGEDPLDGGRFLALLHPDDRRRVSIAYTRALRDGDELDLSGRLCLPGGGIRHLHAVGRRDIDGRYSGTIQDVTQAAEMREQLAAANARLEAVLEYAPLGIYMRDLDGRMVLANRQVAGMLGREPGEVVGRDLDDLVDATAADAVRESDARIVAAGVVACQEELVRSADGGERRYLWHRFPVRDGNDTVTGIGGIAVDITERAEMEAALRETEERFRKAFEESPVGIAILDFDGRLLQVNEALCSILQYPRAELEGALVRALAHDDDIAASRQVMDELSRGRRSSYNAEKQYRTASGTIVDCTLNATLLTGSDGAPRAILAQLQDITERKRHQRRLERLADQDALTGLLNRRAFARELEGHAQRISRHGASGSVLVIDLDGFKHVNDTLGHHAGDELLIGVAQRLVGRLRTSDVIARLGGDEFVVLLPNAGREVAERVAADLIATLRDDTVTVGGREHVLGASVGIAAFETDPGISAEDVIIKADLAMYEDKRRRAAALAVRQG